MELLGQELTCERGGRIVFRDVSLSLKPGQLMQLTGPNGSGKSSLLRLIAGLNEAQEGSVVLEGGSQDLSIGQQAHYVAHQEPVKSALSVSENLAFWRDFLGGGDVDEALDAFDLSRLASYPAGLLSAGQKRRLALARLMLSRRPLWLLDEPLAALDGEGEALVRRLMTRHCESGGLLVAATHAPLGVPAIRL
jgi:heme exporter protein A